jgi:SAM-dependent methyltransferase
VTDASRHGGSAAEALLAEQSDYYRRRAPEYEDWWFRRGRYDRGEEDNAKWFAEATELEVALERFGPHGKVLELACGTGIWTRRLAAGATHLAAVDGSTEMLELNRARLPGAAVAYRQADLFTWEPQEAAYDVCFFGFWLSHVSERFFETFWEKVRRALVPDGRVFFVDSAGGDLSSGVDRKLPEAGETMVRRLEDGREYRIVKRFYEPQALQDRLADLGWDVQVASTTEYFIYGQGSPMNPS